MSTENTSIIDWMSESDWNHTVGYLSLVLCLYSIPMGIYLLVLEHGLVEIGSVGSPISAAWCSLAIGFGGWALLVYSWRKR